MFDKILIANRGEIACRVMRTARRLGIRTVAVYSDADADALHVTEADEAYRIGPAAARDSYLAIDRMIDVVMRSGANAVHPGYGFLSENAAFAEAVAAAGAVFVGPPPGAIAAMGSKSNAKTIMEAAEVPLLPGYHGADQSDAALSAAASEVGYPLLIKASAGGGGRGMRRVDEAAGFEKALAAARREAKGAFGDDSVLIERYLERPRHIEVQVFADSHGNAVHLFERDCSIQRRHQKIVEEAPAPGLDPEVRAEMGEAAVAAAKAIGYEGAGTVEFIADAAPGGRIKSFYFMEMNTRLQVEHPVTEMICGLDLVEWQLRVAAGEPLPRLQDALSATGHAFEVRLYAEDPVRGFLPQTGRLAHLRFPAPSPHVRVDAGIAEGGEISMFYDPMIAKLVVWDHDRRSALRRLQAALRETEVVGVTTNIDFLSAVASHPAFVAGDVETHFVDQHGAELVARDQPVPGRVQAIAALAELVRLQDAARARGAQGGDPYSPWHSRSGWRLNGAAACSFQFGSGGADAVLVQVRPGAGGYRVETADGVFATSAASAAEGRVEAEVDGVLASATLVRHGGIIEILHDGQRHRLRPHDALAAADAGAAVAGVLAAPMPGRILAVHVREGDKVKAGQALVVLEAMKMEHDVSAPGAAVVRRVACAAGDQVAEGAVLVELAAP